MSLVKATEPQSAELWFLSARGDELNPSKHQHTRCLLPPEKTEYKLSGVADGCRRSEARDICIRNCDLWRRGDCACKSAEARAANDSKFGADKLRVSF